MERTPGSSWLQHKLWDLVKSTSPTTFAKIAADIRDGSKPSIFGWYGSNEMDVECPNLSVTDVPNENADDRSRSDIVEFKDRKIYPRFGLFSFPQESFIGKVRISEKMDECIKTRYAEINHDFKKVGAYNVESYISSLPMPSSTHTENQKVIIYDSDVIELEKNKDLKNQRDLIKKHPFTSDMNYLSDFIDAMGDKPFIIMCNVCRSCEMSGEYENIGQLMHIDLLPNIINESYIFNDAPVVLSPHKKLPRLILSKQLCAMKPETPPAQKPFYPAELRGAESGLFIPPQTPVQTPVQPAGKKSSKIILKDPNTGNVIQDLVKGTQIDKDTGKIIDKPMLNKYLKYKAKYLALKSQVWLS